jgi:hypothetical protein
MAPFRAASDSFAFGQLHPDAPRELARFAFLVGRWRCQSRVKSAGGAWRTHPAAWVSRFVLDGYAIADECRQSGADGTLLELNQTVRSYDAARRRWVIRWYDALAAEWLDVAPHELGGVQVDDTGLRCSSHAQLDTVWGARPEKTLYCVSFSGISARQFRQGTAVSSDGGRTFEEVEIIEARRLEP